MRKYLFGILTGIAGALVVKEAYAKGVEKGIKQCTDKLDFIAKIQELKKEDGES